MRQIVIDGTTIDLLPRELPIVLRGELPPSFVERLQCLGVRIPKRGTVPYILFRPDREPVKLYCRRAVPLSALPMAA